MNVLLVEDKDANLMQDAIDAVKGFQMSAHVSSLEEVENEVRKKPFPHDCAIVDMQIYKTAQIARGADERPHTDWGLQAVRSLLSVIGKERLLVLTVYASDVRGQLVALGLQDRLVQKPVHYEHFSERLRQMK